jgi:hypothetical protein
VSRIFDRMFKMDYDTGVWKDFDCHGFNIINQYNNEDRTNI